MPALFDSCQQNTQIMLKQHKIGCFLCHIHSLVNRDADIRGVKGRRVIDAVPHVPHDMAHLFQRQDDPFLLVGIHLSENRRFLRNMPESLILQILHLIGRQDAVNGQADNFSHMPGHQTVVSCDDFYAYS
ncbi:hypothetical protein SDC9_163805 [bioreactor metagenome]|uniref:Uncharacterized protein n=1 Tax=bioreactor metagenome TaxID=1076179 RepID=A0A645FPX0_9ZZZZ